MPDVSFVNLLVVVAVAVLAPLTIGFFPGLRIPAVVLEIVGGIIIGPSVLGWVHVDLPVAILALFGLAFLLFLAGLEITAAAAGDHALGHLPRPGRAGAQGRRAGPQRSRPERAGGREHRRLRG